MIIELCNNSIKPPCHNHGMWGGRMTSCVGVPTKKEYLIGILHMHYICLD